MKSPAPNLPGANVNVSDVRSALRDTVTSVAATPCVAPTWKPVVGLAGFEKCISAFVRLIVTFLIVSLMNGATPSCQ